MKKIFFITIALLLFISSFVNAQCMGGSDDEGVQIVGFIQPQFEYIQHPYTVDDELNFSFERARFGFVGNIPYDFSFYAVVEASAFISDDPFLLDAYVSYDRFAPYFKVVFGQFKNPFGLEVNTACHKLHTIKRSKFVSDLAGPYRDLGIMFTGGNDTTFINYGLAITNGTGLGFKDTIDMYKDFSGRVVFSPLRLTDSELDISLGFGAKYTSSKNSDVSFPDNTGYRLGADLGIKWKNILVQGEFIYGKNDGTYTEGGGCGGDPVVVVGSVERYGYMAQGMYMTPWSLQPVIKYQNYDPNMAGNLDMNSIITFGVNFFPNDWTRLQINYLYSAEEREIRNDQFLVQLQVVFN